MERCMSRYHVPAIVCLVLPLLAATTATQLATQPGKERAIAWGTATDDAQIGLRLNRSFFAATDDPELEIVLRATDKKTVSLVLPDADPKADFRQLLTFDLFRNERSLGSFYLTHDGPGLMHPGENKFADLTGQSSSAKFKLSELTSNVP